MKITLLGYGKMGKEVEKCATKRGHRIVNIFDPEKNKNFLWKDMNKSDVAIDFSIPQKAVKNINLCFDAHLPIITGTTGWYDEFQNVKNNCKKKNGTLFYSTNFSLGVNIFFKINQKLAELINTHQNYEVSVKEVHHKEKKDAPSGTAITISEDIMKNIDRLNQKQIIECKEKQNIEIKNNTLPIYYDRLDGKVGIHQIKYKSDIDQIKIEHEAFNRQGFALGAVIAAEFVVGKKGIFNMNDLV